MIETSAQPGQERVLEIEIAGSRYPARVLTEAPFDPKGGRMRG